jgi:hypothetical protein
MTNKGNIGILRILISSLFQYILNVQIGLWFWLKAFNIESRMLKRVISTRMAQFLSFCPVLPSVRPHEPSVRPHSWLMCTKFGLFCTRPRTWTVRPRSWSSLSFEIYLSNFGNSNCNSLRYDEK